MEHGPRDPTAIRERLERDFGWKIEASAYVSLPPLKTEIANARGLAGDVADLTSHLLERVIIDDGFGQDHGSRRALERENADVSYFNGTYSKLGANNLLGTLYVLEDVVEYVGKHFPELRAQMLSDVQLSDWRQKLGGYKNMDFSGKAAFAREFDDALYSALLVLTQKQPEPESSSR